MVQYKYTVQYIPPAGVYKEQRKKEPKKWKLVLTELVFRAQRTVRVAAVTKQGQLLSQPSKLWYTYTQRSKLPWGRCRPPGGVAASSHAQMGSGH